MKIDQFRQLISESIKEVLVERAEKKKRLNENKKLSVLLKSLIAEIIEEKTTIFQFFFQIVCVFFFWVD